MVSDGFPGSAIAVFVVTRGDMDDVQLSQGLDINFHLGIFWKRRPRIVKSFFCYCEYSQFFDRRKFYLKIFYLTAHLSDF